MGLLVNKNYLCKAEAFFSLKSISYFMNFNTSEKIHNYKLFCTLHRWFFSVVKLPRSLYFNTIFSELLWRLDLDHPVKFQHLHRGIFLQNNVKIYTKTIKTSWFWHGFTWFWLKFLWLNMQTLFFFYKILKKVWIQIYLCFIKALEKSDNKNILFVKLIEPSQKQEKNVFIF